RAFRLVLVVGAFGLVDAGGVMDIGAAAAHAVGGIRVCRGGRSRRRRALLAIGLNSAAGEREAQGGCGDQLLHLPSPCIGAAGWVVSGAAARAPWDTQSIIRIAASAPAVRSRKSPLGPMPHLLRPAGATRRSRRRSRWRRPTR